MSIVKHFKLPYVETLLTPKKEVLLRKTKSYDEQAYQQRGAEKKITNNMESFDWEGESIKQAQACLIRMAARAKAKFYDAIQEETMIKAQKYSIPCDKDTCVFELKDKIEEYEQLLLQAEHLNISYDLNVYDPCALMQEIDDIKQTNVQERHDQLNDYSYSRF